MSGIIAQNTLDSSGLIKSPEGGGAWTFIKKLTASSSSTLSFVDGSSDVVLDSTYKLYLFTFNNIHPASAAHFRFQGSIDTGSNYNVAMTTTVIQTEHAENGSGGALTYETGSDKAQDTSFQNLFIGISNNSDDSGSGYMYLFNPSSTTFVKHIMFRGSDVSTATATEQMVAGYFNTTSAIDAIQFEFSTGNIDTGDICLYGLTI